MSTEINDSLAALRLMKKYGGFDPDQVLLPEEEAAVVVEVKPKTLESWRQRGVELEFTRLGRKIRYRLSALLEYRNRSLRNNSEAKSAA